MDRAIKISDEQYQKVKELADKEGRKIKKVIELALRNYFISKKIN